MAFFVDELFDICFIVRHFEALICDQLASASLIFTLPTSTRHIHCFSLSFLSLICIIQYMLIIYEQRYFNKGKKKYKFECTIETKKYFLIFRRDAIMLKLLLIFLWVFITYQGLHLQCCDSFQSNGLPPDWQVQNSIVAASNNQVPCLRSQIFLYFCCKIKPLFKCRPSYQYHVHISILLLCGDIESNPGPDCYSLRHPQMCGFFRTAVYVVFVEERKLLPQNNETIVCVNKKEGLADLEKVRSSAY